MQQELWLRALLDTSVCNEISRCANTPDKTDRTRAQKCLIQQRHRTQPPHLQLQQTSTVQNKDIHRHKNADQCDIAEGPWNLNNPVKASRSHQELHKELLLAHKKGLVVCCKPELQTVLERRKREQTQREEGEQSRSPLEQVLLQRQQKHQEMMKEEEQKLREEVQLMEFVRVRQNLKKVHTALQKNIHS
ncbi:actin-associated protein FAM107A [Chanodichthys erythropterus]|uniref:actin-associated protein FAM107A n=1 Tax=Chanodichthys erythropterus TaxID=933992 RepID=UPI00351F7D6A